MNGFYVSMIFLGVLLVIFSLICIFLDKRRAFSYLKSYDDKTQKLVEVINDAEQMIDELNRFSDFIVNQIDQKNEELINNLKLAEEKVNALSEKAGMICNGTEKTTIKEGNELIQIGNESIQKGNEYRKSLPMETRAEISGIKVFNAEASNEEAADSDANDLESSDAVAVNSGVIDAVVTTAPHSRFNSNYAAAPAKKREKVIPINNKYSEVIKLSQEGMQDLEIAKRLNMGKGEVELILGLRK